MYQLCINYVSVVNFIFIKFDLNQLNLKNNKIACLKLKYSLFSYFYLLPIYQ